MYSENEFRVFCEERGLNPDDPALMLVWCGALASTHKQPPVAWGTFDPENRLVAVLDAPHRYPKSPPVPLYRNPIAPVQKEISDREIMDAWKTLYQPDGDAVGLVRLVERYLKAG